MSFQHIGDTYLLTGDGETGTISGGGGRLAFIHGSHDTLGMAMGGVPTVVIQGHFDSIVTYPNHPTTIIGFDGTDSLSIFGLWLGTDGKPLAKGADASHAMITSDHHGGCTLSLAFGYGSIHFAGTDASVIRGDHAIIASTR